MIRLREVQLPVGQAHDGTSTLIYCKIEEKLVALFTKALSQVQDTLQIPWIASTNNKSNFNPSI